MPFRSSKSAHPRRTGALGLALLAAAVALNGCSRAEPAAVPARTPAQPPEVSVAAVRHARVPVSLDLPGRTAPYLVAQVRSRVDGIVQKREFIEGSEVKAGQRLYQIDPAPYQATLNNAEGALAKAKANLAAMNAQAERFKALVARNAVSKQDYDNAVSARDQAIADVASARAAVQTARINLGYTEVTAPISGRVGLSAVTEGAYVQASAATLLTTIQQIDPIYEDLNQSSVQGLALRRDVASGKVKMTGPDQARITVFLEDGTEYPIPGTLQFTDITVDQNTGSVTVRAIVPNPDHILLPGMFVRARVNEGVDDNALLVPQAGVTHNPQGQATALVVGQDNRVDLRTIQTTRAIGSDWVVNSGLKEGEKVIVSGVQRVQPGALVRVVIDAVPIPQKSAARVQPAPHAQSAGDKASVAQNGGPATSTR